MAPGTMPQGPLHSHSWAQSPAKYSAARSGVSPQDGPEFVLQVWWEGIRGLQMTQSYGLYFKLFLDLNHHCYSPCGFQVLGLVVAPGDSQDKAQRLFTQQALGTGKQILWGLTPSPASILSELGQNTMLTCGHGDQCMGSQEYLGARAKPSRGTGLQHGWDLSGQEPNHSEQALTLYSQVSIY